MFHGELHVLDGLGGMTAHHDALGHTLQGLLCIPSTEVTGSALIHGVVGQRPPVGHLREYTIGTTPNRLQVTLGQRFPLSIRPGP